MSASHEPPTTRQGTPKRGNSLPVFAALGIAVALGLGALGWPATEQWRALRSARAAFPTIAGEIGMPGISGHVEIRRDPKGVPHIEAADELDGWSALGFSHAQDRLAQMFWLRRLARGRTAEVVGERGLEADRLARTLGLGMHADAEVARMEAGTRQLLDAYASGVNSRIARIQADLVAPPSAMAAASDLAEPWIPGDSLAIVKLMALSAGPAPETAAVLWDLIDRLGAVAARPFLPTGLGVRGAGMATALPASERSGAASGVESGALQARSDSASGLPSRPLMSGAIGGTALADSMLGASAWVVSGRLTRSGAPILSVDLHLPPTVPSLVYHAQLRAGDLDVAGATVPGAPVFWAGRNPHLAWAATPARIVTADWYLETLNPDDPHEYRYGRSWLSFQERTETILVADSGSSPRSESLLIRETRHGPVVNDLIGRAGAPLSMAWTGAVPGNGVTAMIAVARAANEAELRDALRAHHEPAIALLYADSSGAAGLQVAGWIPRRRLPSGLVPMPGRQTVFDWRGPIKPEDLPHRTLDATTDWLVASDGPLVDSLRGRIEWLWRTGEVAARLESRLEAISQAGELLEAQDLAAMRPERWSLRSRAAVTALLELAGERDSLTPEGREVAELVAAWDGTVWSGSRGAAAAHLVFHHLTRELFAGPVGPERLSNYLSLSHTRPQAVAEQILMAAANSPSESGWPERQRVGRAIRASLRAAWMSLSLRLGPDRSQWSWGRVVSPAFRPFAGGGEYDRIAGGRVLEVPDLDRAGGIAAINSADPFEVEASTSYRLVIDLASPDLMLSALAPGQSEHPYHPHFDDGMDSLGAGEWQQLTLGKWDAEAVAEPAAPLDTPAHDGSELAAQHAAVRLVLEPLEPAR